MKIQTNAGEVELTAEMVCRGMVFQSDNWTSSIAPGGVLVMATRRERGSWYTTAEVFCDPAHAQRFLGCDPTIASRADCERYGVHGDAAPHGFARLRGGGAVDLRHAAGKLPVGSVYAYEGDDRRCIVRSVPSWLPDGARLVGLNARHASPADVERLCCGARNEVLRSNVCTLAIGDHDKHEDIATGAKWPAKAERYEYTAQATSNGFRFADPPHAATDKVRLKPYTWGAAWYAETAATVKESARRLAEWEEAAKVPGTAQNIQREAMRDAWADAAMWPAKEIGQRRPDTFAAPAKHVCGKCGGKAHVDIGGPLMVAILGNAAKACKPCADVVCATIDVYEIRDGRIVEKAREASLWSPFAEAVLGLDYTAGPSTSAVHVLTAQGKAGAMEVQDTKPQPLAHALAKLREADATLRRQREAPLLALVAAVPEGLDPERWANALRVCAAHCMEQTAEFPDAPTADEFAQGMERGAAILRLALPVYDAARREGFSCRVAAERAVASHGYEQTDGQRERLLAVLIAPHKAPPPERKRGPGLTVDDGRDE